ncbi:hypothetical protein DMUE_5120 [Dictyocoela muelleri]|nr:hypothetical protein DMUE_5120 [Dictyocoela muelleri]
MSTFYESTIRYLLNASIEDVIQIFQQCSLLQQAPQCEHCNQELSLKKFCQSTDGYYYRCYNVNCPSYLKRISLRFNSLLTIQKFLLPIGSKFCGNGLKKIVLPE